ncbi:MAG TPA: nuclear transport factor 2 family protein [Acidimicrobiales bacterium]|nr:nuclear transport factor 2 family protein [Acidimicrobiales bacterium]
MPSPSEEKIQELGRRWVDAETSADVPALDALTTDDFTLVGPVGFVLDKQQWLDRYRTGGFATHALTWDDVHVRDYGDAAVAIGSHTQEASYQGQPADGQFRATHIMVRHEDGWMLAGMHLSPVGGPPPFTRPDQS